MQRLRARFGRSAASFGIALIGILFLRTALTSYRDADLVLAALLAVAGIGYLVAAYAARPDIERVQTRVLAAGFTVAAVAHVARALVLAQSPVFVWSLFFTALVVTAIATAVAAAGAWLGAPDRRHDARVWTVRAGLVGLAAAFALYVAANLDLGRASTWSILLGDFGIRALAALAAAWGYFETDPPVEPAVAEEAAAPA